MEYNKLMFEIVFDRAMNKGIEGTKTYLVADSWTQVTERWMSVFAGTCELFSITLLGRCADLAEEASG